MIGLGFSRLGRWLLGAARPPVQPDVGRLEVRVKAANSLAGTVRATVTDVSTSARNI